ncbi:MAG: hypothetical protein ACOCXZ_00085 [Chloroflexota bacterium]
MRMRPIAFLTLCLLLLAVPIAAQEADDTPTEAPIGFNAPVTDTITERAIFDRFQFNASAGDLIEVEMAAADGLAPLVGIADAGGTVILSTETDAEGNPLDPSDPNDTIRLRLRIPENGQYTIVATRWGRIDGETTGSYVLELRQMESGAELALRQPVEFRCRDALATTALTVRFSAPDADLVTFRVYGLDGFMPVIQAEAGVDNQVSDCSSDPQGIIGDRVTLPDGTDRVVVNDDPGAAFYGINAPALLDSVRFRLGGRDGAAGRYLLVIDGLSISAAGQTDVIDVQLGPLAVDTTPTVYMVAYGPNRLDPVMAYEIDAETDAGCDDAGLRECDAVPSIEGHGVLISDENISAEPILGDRLDAGLTLSPGSVDPVALFLAGRNPRVTGPYALFIIGELPAFTEAE